MTSESFASGKMSSSGVSTRFTPSLDAQAEMDAVQQLRQWCRDRLELSPGATVIDVGCGTGDELARLAQLVQPGGRAVGVDANEPMLAVARQRVGSIPGVELSVAEAASLNNIKTASVSALVCERVIQHLTHDPANAFGEFARVLMPGGLLAVTDTDWSSAAVVLDNDAEGTALINSLRQRVPLPFTTNQIAGRELAGYCQAAGLDVRAARSATLSDFPPAMVLGVKAGLRAAAEGAGIAESEIAEVERVLTDGIDSGTARITVELHAVVARQAT